MQPILVEDTVREGVDANNVGLALRADRTAILQSQISTWEHRIFERGNATPVYVLTGQLATATNPDGSSVLSDMLINDGHWGIDGQGANWRHTVQVTVLAAYSPTLVLEGGKRYRHEYALNHTTDGIIYLDYVWKMRPGRTT
jgi:hypothetical protein